MGTPASSTFTMPGIDVEDATLTDLPARLDAGYTGFISAARIALNTNGLTKFKISTSTC